MIQFLTAWNGIEPYAISSVMSTAEETRLIAAGIARAYTPGMDGRSDDVVDFAYVGGVPTVTGDAVAAVAGAATGSKQNAVEPPTGAITPAQGAVGLLNGNYSYAACYILDDGTITDPWTGEPTVLAVNNRQINLSTIPVSASNRVVGRLLLRTNGAPVSTKSYRVLTTIPDNVTTTYVDNKADADLGDAVNWAGTQRGAVQLGGKSILTANGQSFALATGATRLGYASNALGWGALASVQTGVRNVANGVYSLGVLTDGVENTADGVHSGQNLTTGSGNVFGGYSAAWWINGDSNVVMGRYGMYGAGVGGVPQVNNGCVILGNGAARDIAAGVDSVIAIGTLTGRYANTSGQLFIDPLGSLRGNLSVSQNSGLMYGEANNSANVQKLRLNASVRLGWGNPTVAQVLANTPNASRLGERVYVTDCTLAMAAANYGTSLTGAMGGGNKTVPVTCVTDDGGATYRWAIG